MNRDYIEYLETLGFPVEHSWGQASFAPSATPQPLEEEAARSVDESEGLEKLKAKALVCESCKLCETRQNVVFGEGASNASLMFVGEGPGADEDRSGRPFVGKAGQLLDKMIVAMGFSRKSVYIANVVKCRPPGNRNPEEDEIASCKDFLRGQIESVQPKIIVALGKFAAQTLIEADTPISKLRGEFHELKSYAGSAQGIQVMPTFHPAFLLRNPDAKKQVWDDLQKVMKAL